jgi:hypothetical protein
MPQPKFANGARVKVDNRDLRGLVWFPKLESLHGQTGTIVDSEYWSTYLLPGETVPTDVYHYEVKFSGGETHDDVPQVILKPAQD